MSQENTSRLCLTTKVFDHYLILIYWYFVPFEEACAYNKTAKCFFIVLNCCDRACVHLSVHFRMYEVCPKNWRNSFIICGCLMCYQKFEHYYLFWLVVYYWLGYFKLKYARQKTRSNVRFIMTCVQIGNYTLQNRIIRYKIIRYKIEVHVLVYVTK